MSVTISNQREQIIRAWGHARSKRSAFAVIAFASVFGVAVVLASCFSERSTGAVVNEEDCNVVLPPEAVGSTIVTIRGFAFNPSNVRVAANAKVTWVNCETSTDAHTSTSDEAGWNSPLLFPGDTYTREFGAAGSYPYHCAPHPGMRATVTVVE